MTRLDWILLLGFCTLTGALIVSSLRRGKTSRSKGRLADNVSPYDSSREYTFPSTADGSVTNDSATIESSDYECDATSSVDCSFDGGGDGGSSD
jgi:hypothetical protein